jgi:hypothetical protein
MPPLSFEVRQAIEALADDGKPPSAAGGRRRLRSNSKVKGLPKAERRGRRRGPVLSLEMKLTACSTPKNPFRFSARLAGRGLRPTGGKWEFSKLSSQSNPRDSIQILDRLAHGRLPIKWVFDNIHLGALDAVGAPSIP